MTDDPILVTGATGKVGGAVVRRLAELDLPVRALVRDRARAEDLPTDDIAVGDLAEPGTLDEALTGIRGTFLVFPTGTAEPAAPELVKRLAGAGPIAYLSAAGAEGAEPDGQGIVGSHALIEHLVGESGAPHTLLRAGGFMGNTVAWADQIRAGDTVRWFHGQARRSLVHERDLAEVGILALTGDPAVGQDGEAYHLTGPESLTQVEQVQTIGEVLGRPLRFVELDPATAAEELFGGYPDEMAQLIVDGHGEMVRHPETVSSAVERLLGRPALSYRSWVEDHAADFS